MKSIYYLVLLPFVFLACKKKPTPKDLQEESIIPRPVELVATGSSFRITEETAILVNRDEEEVKKVGHYLRDLLSPSTSFDLAVAVAESESQEGIYLELTEEPVPGREGYELTITENQIKISANQPVGIFYGIQTLRQLLPATSELPNPQSGPWEIATGRISDYPAYTYRGSMLDISRHFLGPEILRRYVDFLASYKMNYFHLHLSDDQGWRIEINSWPELTRVGGSTEVGGGKGGFLTQKEYVDLVQYAADRYVTIVPEIDMPGHTNAALASYAELNCDGKARDLYTGTDVGFSSLCIDKEVTFQFVDSVVRELAAITPGPFIHIGGDESHSTEKKDFLRFINRVADLVASYDKRMIGWDETAQAEIKEGTVVQLWNNADFARLAVSKGAKLIMSPANKIYLDMKYDSTTALGLSWAGYIEVDTAYLWDPATLFEGIGKADILGIEAPLWTETITNQEELEFMVFPRLPGYAEIGWSGDAGKSWADYRQRLAAHADRFEARQINYYPSPTVEWGKPEE